MIGRRLLELGAMMAIGDGVLAMLYPHRHVELWEGGPSPYRELVAWCDRHPNRTRALGAVEVGLGLWLATRQYPERSRTI